MADMCCDDIVGGLIFVTVGSLRFEGMGEAKIRPETIERSAEASAGGRLVVTEKAVPAEAELSFVNHCDSNPIDLYRARCHVDVAVVEQSRGIRHLFSRATIIGRPEVNLATGEVSGLRIASVDHSIS